jgi:serine/threonine-protein kinase
MGRVYLARKRGAGGFEREVALKLTHGFLREESEWAAQLIEEAKLAGRIHHPNVVQVLDVEDDPQGVFLVMEYVEGDTLGGLLRQAASRGERIPTEIALRILIDALAGLHAAHELRDNDGCPLGLVHRDFTPHNILVGVNGVSRLTDFGVAKAASRVSGTRTGIVKGKAGYMAPEQVRGQPLDRRADVWSAGVVAWEAFAGRRMRGSSEDNVAMLLKVATEAPPRLGVAAPEVPAPVDQAVAWALTSDRTRRCPTARRFAEALVDAWSSSAAPADHATVSAYVAETSGSAIAQRREQAEAVARERAGQTGPEDHSRVIRSKTQVVGRSRTRLLVIGAVGLAALCAVVVVRARLVSPRVQVAAKPSAASPSSQALPAPLAPAPPHSLHVAANAPVSELHVGGSAIALTTPAAELTLEVPPGALNAGVVVSAVAVDGRTATATLDDDPTTVRIDFGDPVAAASVASPSTRPRPAPHPSPRAFGRRGAAPAGSQETPLAASPYEPR